MRRCPADPRTSDGRPRPAEAEPDGPAQTVVAELVDSDRESPIVVEFAALRAEVAALRAQIMALQEEIEDLRASATRWSALYEAAVTAANQPKRAQE